MPFDIGGFTQGVANEVIGYGIGQLQANSNDKRQIAQQQKLTDMQVKAQKDLTDYNRNSAFTQWLNTNYGAQKAQMESAGLNPALMYGNSGGGGGTVQVAPGSVSAGSAPVGGGEQMKGMELGLATQMQQAQINVLNTQAEKNKAEATKTAGIDTDVAGQTFENLRQAFDNTKLDMTMKNILNFEQQASQGDRLGYIEYQTKMALNQAYITANQKQMSDETLQAGITTIKNQAIESAIKNVLLDSQVKNTDADTAAKQESVKKMANDILIGWGNLDVSQKQQKVDELVKTMQANSPSIQQVIGRELNETFNDLYRIFNVERPISTRQTGPDANSKGTYNQHK